MYCYAIPLGIIDIGNNVSTYAFFIARCGSKVNEALHIDNSIGKEEEKSI